MGKNHKKQIKRSRLDDDDVDDYPKKKKNTAESPAQFKLVTLPGFSHEDEKKLQGFERCFWNGPNCNKEEFESLKMLRKELGVLVKGENISHCPPPIDSLQSEGLPPEFGLVFKSIGLSEPTIVQKQCWPAILNGNNILAVAPTGSGKTLAYSLPAIPHVQNRLKYSKCKVYDKAAPMALILVPTRELAIQVTLALKPLKKVCNISCFAVYGGEDKSKQIDDMMEGKGHPIIVSTPGRLVDLLHSKAIVLSNVTYLVIDEADRMLALGFREQITLIAEQIYPQRQSLLFSATFPGKLRELCSAWIPNAIFIRCNTLELSYSESTENALAVTHKINETVEETSNEVAIENSSENQKDDSRILSSYTISGDIEQLVHVCSTHKKPRLLIRYILKVREDEKTAKVRQPGLMLIFCTKIKTLKFVSEFLRRQNQTNFVILHGQLPQNQREKNVSDFRCGKSPILITTDVAARGIHIKHLKYVINYDFPSNLEQYCHRIGRTGRVGEKGFSYSLITRNLAPLTKDLITLLRSCNQEPEPNLISLYEEYNSGTMAQGDCQIDDDSDEN